MIKTNGESQEPKKATQSKLANYNYHTFLLCAIVLGFCFCMVVIMTSKLEITKMRFKSTIVENLIEWLGKRKPSRDIKYKDIYP
jgi:hypothetical protein